MSNDRKNLARFGTLERYMLKFLIENDAEIARAREDIDVSVACFPVFFAFGIYQ